MGQFVVNLPPVKTVRILREGVVVEGTRHGENHPSLEVPAMEKNRVIGSKKAKMMLAIGVEASVESLKVKPPSIESP